MRCRCKPQEHSILAANELLTLGKFVIGLANRVGSQARAVLLISREVCNVVDTVGSRTRSLVWRVITDQVCAALRNCGAPVARIFLERVDLERVDLIANETGDHGKKPFRLVSVSN